MAGRAITLTGTAPAHASVAVHLRSEVRAPFVASVVTANASGRWSVRVGFARWAQYWAAASGQTSQRTSTNRLYPTTLRAPARVTRGALYSITGTTRPGRTLTVYGKTRRQSGYRALSTVRADAHGRYAARRYLTEDLSYRVVGDMSSSYAMTRVQVSSHAPARVRRSGKATVVVTVTGHATPQSRVELYTQPYGHRWRVSRTTTASASTGAWSASFTGSYDTAYLAKDANRTASPSRWVQIRP